MKRIVTAKIAENAPLTLDVFKLLLRLPGGDEPARPGQFVNVYLDDGAHLLPRPISVCRQEGSMLTLVYRAVGEGTRKMAALQPGETLRVSSPLGNGYALPERGHVLLVGGGVGVPPLLQTAYAAKEKGLHVTVAVGYRDALFLEQEFRAAADAFHFATDDGSAGFHGNAVQLLETLALSEGTVVLACGPKPMLRTLQRFCMERTLPLQVSLEERMGCGYGACVGCVCKLRQNGAILQKRVCKDGPVFDGSEVIFE